MHITIKTYTDTRNMEVPQTESALYKAIGGAVIKFVRSQSFTCFYTCRRSGV